MTTGRRIDEALDARKDAKTVTVEGDGARAEIDVVEVDRLGVRVERVRVVRGPRDVEAEAAALPERLRTLPDRIAPVEVDPRLGGATLRSKPEEMRDRDFFQVDVGREDVEVRRYRAGKDGRTARDWTMTREQLGRLIDELKG